MNEGTVPLYVGHPTAGHTMDSKRPSPMKTRAHENWRENREEGVRMPILVQNQGDTIAAEVLVEDVLNVPSMPYRVSAGRIHKTRGKGPTDGGHTGTEKRSTRRSTQMDTPGPAAATPTWNNTGPRCTGGGPDIPATDEVGGPLGGAATTTSKASLESRRGTGGRAS